MKLRNTSLLLLLCLLLGTSLVKGQTSLYLETFETDGEGTRYTSNHYNNTLCDFWERSTATPLNACFGTLTPFTGFLGGFFWGSEDIESSPGPNPAGFVTSSNIAIGGYGTLQVSLFMATPNDNTTRWETADSINIQASIDGGAFKTVGRFMGDNVAGGNLKVDANLNGAIDPGETTIASIGAFTKYTFSIAGTGTTLQIKVDADQIGGSEELGWDNLEVTGITACTAPTITCPAAQTLALNASCQAPLPNYTALGTVTGPCSPVVSQSPAIAAVQTGTGAVTVTLTATNTALQTGTCTFTVNKTDAILPTITCPANISQAAGVGTCAATVTYSAPVGNDNCSGSSTARLSGGASGSPFALGTNTVVYRVTDVSGNSTTCSFTITVTDGQLPVISCPANQTVTAGTGLCTATATYTAPVGTDNCSGPTTTQTAGLASGATFPAGTTTNTFRVTDGSANTATCSFTITVSDNQLPAITCPANQTLNAGAGLCTGTATYTAPVGTDNCAGQTTTRTAGLASGSAFPVGVNNVTYRVTDANANTATCSFTITVIDNQVPAITCPANQSVGNTLGQCTATASYTAPVGTDNCTGSTTSRISGPANGATLSLGVSSISYQVTDAAGNTASCAFTITVSDNQLPSITCPANQSVNAALGGCTATVTYTAPVGTDNCAGPSTSRTTGLASGSSFPTGSTVVTFQVTDASANTATCAFTVTVADNQFPTIACPAGVSLNTAVGLCTATATYTAPVGADNCSGSATTRTTGLASGSAFPVGVNSIVYRVTDASGNTATCSFNVTVTDAELPAITCPANQTVNTAVGTCAQTVSYTAPTGTDNCPAAATIKLSGLATGASFPLGTSTIVYRVTDGAGNSTTCSFTVTVVDNQLPTLTCPSSQSLNATTGACSAPATYVAPIGADNCSILSTARTGGLASGSSFPIGISTIVYQTTDGSSNTSTCSFTITIVDNQLPTIACQANVTTVADPGLCTAVVNFTPSVGADNCPGVTTTQTSGGAPNTPFAVGATTVKYVATDASGNTNFCTFLVTVTDNQAPTITCPPNQTVGTVVGGCNAPVTYTAPVTGDNCAVVTTTQTTGLASGANFPRGIVTNTFRATDAAGNSTTCTFTITVNDNQPPTIACPPNQTVNTAANQCSAVVTYPFPTGSDNCSGVVGLQLTGLTSGSTFPLGTTVNTFRLTDAGGNTATCAFNIVVVDATLPTWANCPANQTVSSSVNSCTAVATWTPPTVTDNCIVNTSSTNHSPGSSFPFGPTTVTYTATDGVGNVGTCSFIVDVIDNVAPVAICQNLTVTLNGQGNGSTAAAAVNNGSHDNCGVSSMTLSQTAFNCSNVGANTVTLTVIDINANTGTCNATITVVAQALAGSVSADTANCNYNVSCLGALDGTAHAAGSGGCGNFTYLWSTGATTGTIIGIGAGTYTVTITDAAGATFVNSVVLTAPPAITVTGTVDSTCAADSIGTIDATAAGGNSCSAYTYLWSNGATTQDLTGLPAGNYTVTVTDINGCTATQTFTVGTFAPLSPTISLTGLTFTSVQTWSTYQWLFNGTNISGANANAYTATQTGAYSLLITDANGCSALTDTLHVTLVGIGNAMGDWDDLKIYPNPARREFRLQTAAPIGYALRVTIHDMYGRRLADRQLPELSQDVAFDITKLVAGTYIVEVVSDFGQHKVFRLVVE